MFHVKPYCGDCKTHHEKYQAHIWPKEEKKVVFEEVRKQIPAKPPVRVLVGFDKTRYQEGYMRVWRALKSGRACRWPQVSK